MDRTTHRLQRPEQLGHHGTMARTPASNLRARSPERSRIRYRLTKDSPGIRASHTRRNGLAPFPDAVKIASRHSWFLGTLKKELVNRQNYRSRHHARLSIRDWIEAWYNPAGFIPRSDISHRTNGRTTTTITRPHKPSVQHTGGTPLWCIRSRDVGVRECGSFNTGCAGGVSCCGRVPRPREPPYGGEGSAG